MLCSADAAGCLDIDERFDALAAIGVCGIGPLAHHRSRLTHSARVPQMVLGVAAPGAMDHGVEQRRRLTEQQQAIQRLDADQQTPLLAAQE
ncbi:MAG: hypothetical protein N838_33575 [Thiohalocapsa sp. PB-PSB1]|jgi:hypothetical protein|nr:MAG: hypothetical protein N838_33575 [Thiohalocapsa sp. PB-PSB1]